MDPQFDFDNMTIEEIHGIKRDDRCDDGRFENDAIINKAIADYFVSSDRFDLQQEKKEIDIEDTLYQNPYAVRRKAEYYRDGIGVEESDELYIKELERFIVLISDVGNYVRIAKDLYDYNYQGWVMADQTINDWYHLSDLGEACLRVGIYYSTSSDIEVLRPAEWYLRVALWNHFGEAMDYLDKVDRKIAFLTGNKETKRRTDSQLTE